MINTNNDSTWETYLRPRWGFASVNNGSLAIQDNEVERIAKRFGTPFYLTVESEIRVRLRRLKNAFPYSNLKPQYAIKCNSNIEILKIVREEGYDADASSVGEIILSMLAGFRPEQITLTNLYKSENDILFAARLGLNAITIDSLEELEKTARVAKSCEAPIRIFLRFNPKIEFGEYTTTKHQYGIPIDHAKEAINKAAVAENIELVGIHWHGAYVPDPEVYHRAMRMLIPLVAYAREMGCDTHQLDLGGGFPVEYGDKRIFTPEEMGPALIEEFEELLAQHGLPQMKLIFEPGKFIVANSEIGVMRVVSVKDLGVKKVIVVDGSTYAMLPDPLTWACEYHVLPANNMDIPPEEEYDIYGCTCDYLDKISKSRRLPALKEGDLLAVMDCGAYSNVMASNFNALKRPPMIMIKEDGSLKIIRRRDRYSEMFANELEVTKTENAHQLKNIYNLIRQATMKPVKAGVKPPKEIPGEIIYPD
ncbi:diaminopimelate decarboxylase [Candidatus Woesearchaeota archaeon]|nr:diaminopimelate decarboxylase [Candidatus Woesearchaeota archaeon]